MKKVKGIYYKNFKFDDEDYDIDVILKGLEGDDDATHTAQEYRQEYARLYGVVKSRLARFEEQGLTKSKEYQKMKNIKPQSKLDNRSLGFELVKVHRFLNSTYGTISGVKAKNQQTIQMMRDNGVDWLTQENVLDFQEFMDKAISAGYGSIYGSERLLEAFEGAVLAGIDTSNLFEEFERFISEKMQYAKETSQEDIDDFIEWTAYNSEN